MRFVILGAGAIGGVVGARLHQSGAAVELIARGRHYEAIAGRGLTLETPVERVTLPIPVAPTPDAVDFRPGDVVLLATKGQDTPAALDALRDAAPAGTPVVCLQNGVENERVVARLFTNVYGAVVMCPAAHLEPGVVLAYGARLSGQIDVGRYPEGIDACARAVCAAVAGARFDSEPRADVMRYKHAKLIANLSNAVQAICGQDAGAEDLIERARGEARTVLSAAGIACEAADVADMHGRWERWGVGPIGGRERAGGSSWQSVIRGAPTIETDYLNGEIVLQGRLTGVPTPVNALLQGLAHETIRDRHQPGWLPAAEILERL
jgi:2-dehydropantoate 2-reductase